jgi:hypothetical protein
MTPTVAFSPGPGEAMARFESSRERKCGSAHNIYHARPLPAGMAAGRTDLGESWAGGDAASSITVIDGRANKTGHVVARLGNGGRGMGDRAGPQEHEAADV